MFSLPAPKKLFNYKTYSVPITIKIPVGPAEKRRATLTHIRDLDRRLRESVELLRKQLQKALYGKPVYHHGDKV